MSDIEQAKRRFFEALAFIDLLDFQSAELRLREALTVAPTSVPILTNLSVVLLRQNKRTEAQECAAKALSANAGNIEAMLVLAECHTKDNRPAEALAILKNVISSDPKLVEAHNHIGFVFRTLGRLQEALDSFDRVIALKPDFIDAYNSRGNVLHELRRYDGAVVAYDRVLALKPDFAEAWLGRGNVFYETGRYDEAIAAYDNALALKSDLAEAWLGRGYACSVLLRYDEARAAHRRALSCRPNSFEALRALTLHSLSEGNIAEAFDLARRAFAAGETPEAKALVASCLCSPLMHPGMGDFRDLLSRALSEPWSRSSELAPVGVRFLVLNDAIREGMARAAKAWPKLLPAEELLDSSSLAKVADDRLFAALLANAPICGVELERFATGFRFSLLAAARSAVDSVVTEPVLGLFCALARQCFINNYVFMQTDAEIEQAEALRDELVASLASGADISALSLLAVAVYVPLHTLPRAEELLHRPWPDAVGAVLAQQVRAPLEEQRLRSSMPVLTAMGDDVSMQVRGQYEENPYPRWVRLALPSSPETVNVVVRKSYPLSPFVEFGKSNIDILVAGCGTGQHPIETACRFQDARVLAVDLSLTSLCFAQRQTQALGLNNIHYAQADIMNLRSIGRSFDVIEAVGVLHHLADPFAGWRELLSLLRPGGIMRLGLYSKLARQDIVAARDFIAARGYRPTAEDIRRCRHELLDCADGTPLKNATLGMDFFSLSGCRDLLFHIQEHRLTLPEIGAFIAENNLQFLGFDLDLQIRQNYARQFPGDVAMTDLAQWNQYETDNPRTFYGMYQFCVQGKPDRVSESRIRTDSPPPTAPP